MIHRAVMIVAVACLGVMASEPPVSPWQALNPALADASYLAEAQPYESTFPEEPYMDDPPYVTTYNDTTELSDEESALMESLPFKIPFKLNKKQLVVGMKLLKEVAKPILKSKRLREIMAYVDDSLASYREDLQTQIYVSFLLDSLQDIYEGKETTQFNAVVKNIFTDLTDEPTARSLRSVWRSLTPSLRSWVYDPFRDYVVSPMRSMIYEPLSNYLTEFSERVETWMGGSDDYRETYFYSQYPEHHDKWSKTVSSYTNAVSDWTKQARQGLEVAARVLEAQDAARCGGGVCGSDAVDDNFGVFYTE